MIHITWGLFLSNMCWPQCDMVFIMGSELATERQWQNFPDYAADTWCGVTSRNRKDSSGTKATFHPMIFIFWKVLLNPYGGHKAYMSILDFMNIDVIYSAPGPHIFLDFLALWTLPIAFSLEHFWMEGALINPTLDTCLPKVLFDILQPWQAPWSCTLCGVTLRHPDLGILTSLPLLSCSLFDEASFRTCIILVDHIPEWYQLTFGENMWGSLPIWIFGSQKEFSIWPDLVTSYGQHRCEIKSVFLQMLVSFPSLH